MFTAIRIKKLIDTDIITLNLPELRKLKGRDVEIIILVEGEIEDSSVPTKTLQNSTHAVGSSVLDEEAVKELLDNRFK